jgi:hypothetical protein
MVTAPDLSAHDDDVTPEVIHIHRGMPNQEASDYKQLIPLQTWEQAAQAVVHDY